MDRRLDGRDLTRGTRIWIESPDDAEVRDRQIALSPRIGVTSAHGLELRFFVKVSPFVSGPRRPSGANSQSD
ncbi:MAG: DNA-3-methyladenine glycosylase [Planctomycetaceae bacterium]